jgi:hypothetical protein
MDPKSFLDSFGGVVAVIGTLAVPIVGLSLLAYVLSSSMTKRHVERMKMIESGLVPPKPRRSRNWFPLLITGAIFTAFGLAMTIVGLRGGDEVEPGLIFGLIGLALLGCFAYIRRAQRSTLEPQDRPHLPNDTDRLQ